MPCDAFIWWTEQNIGTQKKKALVWDFWRDLPSPASHHPETMWTIDQQSNGKKKWNNVRSIENSHKTPGGRTAGCIFHSVAITQSNRTEKTLRQYLMAISGQGWSCTALVEVRKLPSRSSYETHCVYIVLSHETSHSKKMARYVRLAEQGSVWDYA